MLNFYGGVVATRLEVDLLFLAVGANASTLLPRSDVYTSMAMSGLSYSNASLDSLPLGLELCIYI